MIRPTSERVIIPPEELEGELLMPATPRALVIFAHGSGSSRFSPRNRHVALKLAEAGFAALLFDLLSETEALDRTKTFDIPLLSKRLTQAIDWTANREGLARMTVGLFGASTGAAAALIGAAERPSRVCAVVSRGGRPDLAEPRIEDVKAPVLLIVGGEDHAVIGLNRQAARRLATEAEISIVPGAGHLFEEPGALDSVTDLAIRWFNSHLPPPKAGSAH